MEDCKSVGVGGLDTGGVTFRSRLSSRIKNAGSSTAHRPLPFIVPREDLRGTLSGEGVVDSFSSMYSRSLDL
jgi:hypothetical protein